MNMSVIDPIRKCYWCGEPSEKIFLAEHVNEKISHMYLCACGAQHAQLFADDVAMVMKDMQSAQPQSWRMKNVVTSWMTQKDRHPVTL